MANVARYLEVVLIGLSMLGTPQVLHAYQGSTFDVPFALQSVQIDGHWTSDSEWSDASELVLGKAGARQHAVIRMKHDSSFLYILWDFVSDTRIQMGQSTKGDRVSVRFDVNHDGVSYPNVGPDFYFFVYWWSDLRLHVLQGLGAYGNAEYDPAGIDARSSLDRSPLSATPHVIYEIRIRKSNWLQFGNSPAGFQLLGADAGAGGDSIQYPENSSFDDAGSWGEMRLTHVDSDSDGLYDDEELALGTDPLKSDTDGDGLEDGDEVRRYHTDPAKSDTDGDGLDDAAELLNHQTDPLRTDTDGDGLEDGSEVGTHGTNPTDSDTDGDGINDGDEIENLGTNPNSADTDRDGLNDGDEVSLGTSPSRFDTDEDFLSDGIDPFPTNGILPHWGAVAIMMAGMIVALMIRRPQKSDKTRVYGTDHVFCPICGFGLSSSSEYCVRCDAAMQRQPS